MCVLPVCPLADGYPDIKMNVKFVQDTSKYWYKPDISREQGERGGGKGEGEREKGKEGEEGVRRGG